MKSFHSGYSDQKSGLKFIHSKVPSSGYRSHLGITKYRQGNKLIHRSLLDSETYSTLVLNSGCKDDGIRK